MSIRLDKYLCDSGYGTRKEVKALISDGKVYINFYVCYDNAEKIEENKDVVIVNGEKIEYRNNYYFMMHKPCGVITAVEDVNQQTVIDILPERIKRLKLFPVGRLDKDTSGLLLLTNDGEFAHKVISPKYEIEKCYYAKFDGCVSDSVEAKFKSGIILKDGTKCLPAKFEKISQEECLIRVKEGKYHQVRRMLASQGLHCVELKRLSIGKLTLGNLEVGSVKELFDPQLFLIFQ